VHAQPAVNCEHFYMYNTCSVYAEQILSHTEHTRNEFHRMLSIRGTDFIACMHRMHARKCLKVEYLGRIGHNFQKSRVTGPWDHMVSVSAKKVKKKISCLCTFNSYSGTSKYQPQQCDLRRTKNFNFCLRIKS
jgi:hypothetical protein